MKDQRLYLRHVLESGGRIREYLAPGRDFYLSDPKTQDAVLRNLQILAESTQRLSPELKALRPEIPWRAIAGLRNLLVHDYLGVDPIRVWEICHRDLPVLEAAVADLLAHLEAG